eukprot:scaffold17681_cov155-Amphora_coffeaeformis.AAC.1
MSPRQYSGLVLDGRNRVHRTFDRKGRIASTTSSRLFCCHRCVTGLFIPIIVQKGHFSYPCTTGATLLGGMKFRGGGIRDGRQSTTQVMCAGLARSDEKDTFQG